MPKLSGITHQRAVKAFEKSGFRIARQGKLITMTNGERTITIPRAIGGSVILAQKVDRSGGAGQQDLNFEITIVAVGS